jgi:serine/threonine protein kinase
VFVREIGTGNASTVWYAFCKKTSLPLAIKTYKKRKLSALNRRQVAREVTIHAQLDHPNVIALVSLGDACAITGLGRWPPIAGKGFRHGVQQSAPVVLGYQGCANSGAVVQTCTQRACCQLGSCPSCPA